MPQVMAYMGSFSGARGLQSLEEGVGKAAIKIQDIIREDMESMVYSQGQSASGYERTRTLLRSAHAARPSNEHGSDEDRALGGADLKATKPREVVERRGKNLVSEAGTWISYAEAVHDGLGRGERTAKPFITRALNEAANILDDEVVEAILRVARA